ncbi:hypothetical protein H8K33_00185 [Undibacterium amnicola]|uniref:HNH endonuclease n=1 Tax=Undibacterium amnicola TaxID=1834038 RepID=A0ABR6XK73_9BURK|nr:hypothetical protein [Undibacterium amnicola]MBC3829918.1 hypothetical protein [Undibacterium amnicola]
MANIKLYDAVRNHDFAENTCFLCGARTGDDDDSKEHVFPKWLLHHFGLWNKRLTLINGTEIPYRMLVIPCCTQCNNTHLSQIENTIRTAFLAGASALRGVDREVLMLWILKIFFGLLYREIFLPMERRDPAAGSIVTTEDMEQYQLLHYILQASRIPIRFSQLESDIPASLFIFELKEPANPNLRFDYKDDVAVNTLYLRMGKVGILAAFDMGAQTFEGSHFFSKYQNHQLHPLQFEELGANLFMKAKKFNRIPKAMIAESPSGIDFQVAPIAGLSTRPVFEKWSSEEMAEMLMFFLGYLREAVMPVEDRLASWLHREDGSFWHMDINVPPWSITSEAS